MGLTPQRLFHMLATHAAPEGPKWIVLQEGRNPVQIATDTERYEVMWQLMAAEAGVEATFVVRQPAPSCLNDGTANWGNTCWARHHNWLGAAHISLVVLMQLAGASVHVTEGAGNAHVTGWGWRA
jgi:hypothetical protein